ncbi:MAG: YoaK family protein [Fimbriimonadaceae bacterium]
MTNLDRNSTLLAVALSSLAGYVDSIGFLNTGGFFVSFMTGNSTRLGVATGIGELNNIVIAAGVIFCFLIGVAGGTLIAERSTRRKRMRVLLLVSGLLALATFSWIFHVPHLGLATVVMAMGAVNAVFHQEGEISIGLTYMTGVLVKCGQMIAGVFLGKPRWEWLPYLMLWFGLICGAALGAWAYSHLGTNSLAFAVGWSLILAIIAGQREFTNIKNKSGALDEN